MEVKDGRRKIKERSADRPSKIPSGRKARKALSSVSAEDLRQWLQTIRISELHRFR